MKFLSIVLFVLFAGISLHSQSFTFAELEKMNTLDKDSLKTITKNKGFLEEDYYVYQIIEEGDYIYTETMTLGDDGLGYGYTVISDLKRKKEAKKQVKKIFKVFEKEYLKKYSFSENRTDDEGTMKVYLNAAGDTELMTSLFEENENGKYEYYFIIAFSKRENDSITGIL